MSRIRNDEFRFRKKKYIIFFLYFLYQAFHLVEACFENKKIINILYRLRRDGGVYAERNKKLYIYSRCVCVFYICEINLIGRLFMNERI